MTGSRDSGVAAALDDDIRDALEFAVRELRRLEHHNSANTVEATYRRFRAALLERDALLASAPQRTSASAPAAPGLDMDWPKLEKRLEAIAAMPSLAAYQELVGDLVHLLAASPPRDDEEAAFAPRLARLAATEPDARSASGPSASDALGAAPPAEVTPCECPGVKAGFAFAHLPDCPNREARPFA